MVVFKGLYLPSELNTVFLIKSLQIYYTVQHEYLTRGYFDEFDDSLNLNLPVKF